MKAQDLLAKYKAGQRDFTGVDLSGENAAWSCLSKIDLRTANLQNINLSCVNLSQANLSEGTNLSFADLSRADLSEADLRGSNLEGANLDGVIFEGTLYDDKTIFPRGFNPLLIKPKLTVNPAVLKDHHKAAKITAQPQKITPKLPQSPKSASTKIIDRISGFLEDTTQKSTFLGALSQHTTSSNPNPQPKLTNKRDRIHQPIRQWTDRESDRNDSRSDELNDLKTIKNSWKVKSKKSDDSVNYTYLNLDNFIDANSIEEVHKILEEILQKNFKPGVNYIVYDFYYISNKIFNELNLIIKRNYSEACTSLAESSKQEFSPDSQRHTYIGALLVLLGVGLIGLVTLLSNQSKSDFEIDLGVTSEDIRFGVKKVKTYTNEMATHALILNKKCIDLAKEDACVEYKRLYDTFLNGGLNIDTGVRTEESKPTTSYSKSP